MMGQLKIVQFLFIFMTLVSVVNAQEKSSSNEAYNNVALAAIENESIGEAILFFERAARSSSSKERKIAQANVKIYRRELDLPEHTWLHVGWQSGIGRLAHRFPTNFWYVFAVLIAMGACGLAFFSSRWSWLRLIMLLAFSIIAILLARARQIYVEAEHVIVVMTDSILYDKPYQVSQEKQTVFAGQLGQILSEYEGYYKIQTDTYEIGWVEQSSIQSIW